MHELALSKRIVEMVEKIRHELHRDHVKVIYVEIGQLVAVEKSSLALCFRLLVKDSALEGAVLEMIDVPAQAICESCGNVVSVQQYYDPCADCGEFSLRIIAGEELRVQSMEVE